MSAPSAPSHRSPSRNPALLRGECSPVVSLPESYTRFVCGFQGGTTRLVDGRVDKRRAPLRPMNFKVESGRRLQAARQNKRLSLAKLSQLLDGLLSPSRISNYEQGTRGFTIKEAKALGRVLGVDPAYLLCADTEDEDMTPQERDLMRNFRALPEKDRNEYSRRIEVLAMAYREPVPDERLSDIVRRGARKPTKPKVRK
jgi:transcriptional regulator with XRE-family HTH domain